MKKQLVHKYRKKRISGFHSDLTTTQVPTFHISIVPYISKGITGGKTYKIYQKKHIISSMLTLYFTTKECSFMLKTTHNLM